MKIKLLRQKIKRFFENKEHRIVKLQLRAAFFRFFEGERNWNMDFTDEESEDNEYEISPVIDVPVDRFGITKVAYKFKDRSVTLCITLKRPGLFIGKGGENIDKVKAYLNNCCRYNVKLHIEESKDPWRT